MNSKTHLCKHNYSCFENIIRKFLRGLGFGFIIKIPLSIIIQIIKGKHKRKEKTKKSLYKKIVNIFYISKDLLLGSFNKDTYKFILYFAVWLASFPLILCILRRYRYKDNQQALNHGIAGLISGLAIMIDEKGTRRNEAAVYLFSRAACSCWKLGVENKIVPSIPYGDVWIFCLFAAIIQYTFIFEPDLMRRQFYQFIDDLARDPQGRLDKFLLNLRRQFHIYVPNGHEIIDRSSCNTDYYYTHQMQPADPDNYFSEAHKPYFLTGDCIYFDDL